VKKPQFRFLRPMLIPFVLGALLSVGLFAQTAGSGSIAGTVTDPTGAVVPAASVTVHAVDTGIDRNVATNEAGIYTAAFLQPGNYEVTASKAGFTTTERKGLNLQVGQTLGIDFALTIQSGSQAVTVTTETPVVDTEKTEQSQVVSEAAVENLPIAGRRWDSFVLLTPNVTTDGTSGMVSYRGISGLYNSNTVDGANNNQALFSEARGRALSGAYVFSLDSIQEYQVSASNFGAELGQAAGGVVNAVTKSGTNQIHGDLFYYLRYPSFNALDSLPKSQGIYSQPIHQWQQFGGSVGGPIIKDKLFFFGTYDGSRKVNPITYTSTTYTSTVRSIPCTAVQVTAAQCAAANAFLAGQTGQFPRATNQDVGFGKLDYQINSKNHVSSSFDWMNYNAPNSYTTSPSSNNSSLGTNGSYVFHERIFVTNLDTIITNNIVNNLRYQWGRDLEVAGSNAPAPYVSISNVMAYGEFYALPRTAEPDEHRTQTSDTVSIVHGRHTIKAGFDLNFIHEVMINLFNGPGQYSYTGAAGTAFNNWVDDVYGINVGDGHTGQHYNTFTQVTDPVTGVGKDDFWDNDYAGFVTDSWKATQRLTLNLGVRYDLTTIPAPPKPNLATPLTTLYTSTINVPKDEFQPRLGFAWQAMKGTVVRGGYGMYYAKTTNTTFYATRVENGVIQQTFNCTPTTCPQLSYPNLIFSAPGPALASPFAGALTPTITPFTPPALTQSARGQTPNFVNPLVHEGEVAIEHELPGGLDLSATYLLSRGLHLPIFTDQNLAPSTTTKSYDILNSSGGTAETYTVPFYTQRIDPTGEIFVGQSTVNSWYNAMAITLRRPMRKGLEFTFNYTLSKSTDGAQVAGSNGTFNGSDLPVDPKNLKAEYGVSDLDQRHRFVGNVVYMPTFKLNNKPASMIANGWAFSSIITMSSGQPLTAFISGTPSPLDGGLTGGEASNASPTAGRAGWLPRNGFNLPNFYNVDLRIAREFKIRERMRFSILGEAFNLFNHTNVSSENTTGFTYSAAGSGACAGHTNACLVPSPTFLTTSATSNLLWGSRQLQISARLSF